MEFLITERKATTISALIKTLAREYESSKKRRSALATFCTAGGEQHKSRLRRPENKRDYTLLRAHCKRPGCDSSLYYTFFLQRASKISSPRVATHTRQRFISFTRTRDAFNSSSWSESFYLSGKGRRGSLLQRHRSFMFLSQPSCAGNSYYVHRDIMSSLATPLSSSFY
jgi:hypothetical protein